MSSRSQKRAALRAMKEARSKQEQGLGVARTDEYQVKDEGDVYEIVDEDEYQNLVDSRRQREDFVVDDDGLGYYDDGEERLGDEEEETGRSKKRSGTTANLTTDALKRARKTNAALAAKRKRETDEQGHNNKDEATTTSNNKSMWDFVNRGGATSTAAVSASASRSSSSAARPAAARSVARAANLDSMLGELDDVTPSHHHRRRQPAPVSRRRGPGRSTYGTHRSAGRRPPPPPRRSAHATEYRRSKIEIDDDMGDHDDGGCDWDNDDTPVPMDTTEESAVSPVKNERAKDGTTKKTTEEEVQEEVPNKDEGDTVVESKPVPMDTELVEGSNKDDQEPIEDDSPKPVARKRFARTKLGRLSAPAKKALEEEQKKKASQETTGSNNTAGDANKPGISTTAPSAVDMNSSSFKPDMIEGESPQSAAAAAAAAGNLESVVQQGEKDGETYLDMFWIDLAEKNGVIYLFGKVQVKHETPGNKKPTSSFVSCCAVVKNNLRNLFVLPKRKADGEYESMVDVHSEIKSVLQPSCIPHVQGATWASKVVTRKYAFDDPSIPRDETQYLKVVYDAKFPVPPREVCADGGKSFDKILGAGASTLENFVVKRKLMGPCWIRIKNPESNGAPISWCKLELQVDNPKNISRIVENGANRPPPPVVTVSLKLKTIVNPKTHKSEIVSVSAICHKQVLLDTASDESTRNMTQLALIRPLGTAVSAGGLSQFPRDMDQEIKINMPQLQKMPNERALLSRLFTQIGLWDPDVLVGHNAWGYDVEVLLSRCVELKVSAWSKIGRRRRMQIPSRTHFSSGKGDWAIADALSGRLLCDTYVSAKELLRETTYSLTNLAATQLKTQRTDIEPVDIPQWYNASKTIVQLARHTLSDAQLVQRLMFKLQILPLTKQLTCIAGNLWARTMKGNRAERNEYLLLHEFHQLKFIAPEKKKKGFKHGSKGGAAESSGGKAKYSGGLVLEPKKGLYDSFILLLDFNSLYPSLIQEYNLCFTTMDWSTYQDGMQAVRDGGDEHGEGARSGLPPIPDESTERGVLPRVIKGLVERRRAVKKMLKNEKDTDKREELDIRQKALKLTANSMYGCLGFSHSRFYAQPIAALVTAMGRESLQRTVDVAQDTVGLEVIYGDTDSIMINTRITDKAELPKVHALGEKVKKEVNKLYKTLELEIDGVFRSMLLLKKKKYAAVTVEQKPDGEVEYGKETKGLDLVRRDWCNQSKDTGHYVLDQILSCEDRELVVKNIHDHLEELAKKMRNHELPLEKYVITKGLSKHPNDYPDGKSQPHVHVAKMMLKNNRPVNTGDHIPYVITTPLEEDAQQPGKAPSAVQRARHPEEIARSAGALKPDVEWYLVQQILPPISRLCEPIDGTSQSIIAEKLGLDSSKYNHAVKSSGGEIDEDELVDYTPESSLSDEERFKDVEKLMLKCSACGVRSEFPGVFYPKKDTVAGGVTLIAGLRCVNPDCAHPEFWGMPNHMECLARISNAVSVLVHRRMNEYYQGRVRCDDPMCHLETRQLSVAGGVCLARGCNGRMHSVFNERALHTQLKYLDSLFDANHACDQLEQKKYGVKAELLKSISKYDKVTWEELHQNASKYLRGSAYNWIGASLWSTLFGSATTISAKQ